MSPLLEPIQDAETLKREYPFWWNWLQELGRSAEDVQDYTLQSGIRQVPSDTEYKKFEPTGKYIAYIYFKDGSLFEREVNLTEGGITALPDEEKP